jgi:hypothetical protein
MLRYLFTFFLFAALVVADRSSDRDEDDEANEQRNLPDIADIENDGQRVRIELPSGNDADEIDFEMEVKSKGLDIEFEFERDVNENDGELELETSITLFSIIEFSNADNSAVFDANTSNVIKEVIIGDLTFNNADVSKENEVITVVFSTNPALLETTVQFASTQVIGDNFTITPQAAKITVKIIDFPFDDDANRGRLAIKANVKSSAEVEDIPAADAAELVSYLRLQTLAQDAVGFFDWADQASVVVNGAVNVVSVIASEFAVVDNDDNDFDPDFAAELQQRIVFSFDAEGPDNVDWDPELGFARINGVGRAAGPCFMLLAVIMAFLHL